MPRRRQSVDVRAMLSTCEAAPMSRAEIARQTGLDRSAITRLATGERGTRPSYETVTAVRALYDAVTARTLPTVNK
jgi:transcriptional regulator with XRE-family HTH domain